MKAAFILVFGALLLGMAQVAVGQTVGPGSYWLRTYSLADWEWDIDHDNDTYTAREEYASGTDPFNATSRLTLDISADMGNIILTWDSLLGVTYQVLGSANMVNYTPILGPVPGDGFPIDVVVTPPNQTGFYRLSALSPVDEDNDGLSTLEEALLGTFALVSDSDRDGVLDGDEVHIYGTSPTVFSPLTGTIRGTAYNDPNHDGLLGDGVPMVGVLVYLDANFNGALDAGERSVMTGSDGRYTFLLVPPGIHHVRQELPAPNVQTFPVDGVAPNFDMLPDEVVNYTHAAPGVGNFDVPYGENASDWPANWGEIESSGLTVEPVASVNLVLKPIGVRNEVPALLTRHGSEFLSMPQGAHITLRFDEVVVNGAGPDFLIYSINASGAVPEQIEVFVGPTPTSLISIGTFSQSLGTIPVDLGTHGITSSVQYVRCVSLNNGGDWFGFELVGMEALNIASPDAGAHIVTITANETVSGRDFGRYFRDLPPTVILSAADDVPGTSGLRAGETITVRVAAFDDIGIAARSLKVNGQTVALNSSQQAVVALVNPGEIFLEASATDTGGQTITDTMQLYVLNANGTFPFDPNQVGQSTSSNASAPKIRILSPGAGEVSSVDESIIASITGNPAPTSWTVEYAPVDDIDPYNLAAVDADYISIGGGTGAVFSSPVATLPLSTLPDGIYFVRISAQNSPLQIAYYGQVVAKNVPEAALRPQVTITSPAPGSAVTMTTNINGTITSTRPLREWYAEYARADLVDLNNLNAPDSDWVRFASGATTINAPALIANFDGTILKNNGYVVRVVAWNDIGLGWAEPLALEVTGEAKLGRNRLEFRDLSVDLAGFPLQFVRVYDSLQADENGELGYGWSLDLQDADIRETVPDTGLLGLFGSTPFRDGTRVYVTAPTGERLGFTFHPVVGAPSAFGSVYKATFEADPGVYHKLEIPEGDRAFLDLRADGNVYLYFFGFPYNPEKYILTDPQGSRFTYHEDKGFLQAEDLNGNKITLNEDGIDHTAGLGIRFTRDVQGRITKITDPEGNEWDFGYNAGGDLTSMTDPDNRVTTYSYFASPAHYLDTITDPFGRMPRRHEYDPVSGRLVAVIDENGNRTEMTVDPLGFTGSSRTARGHVTQYEYDVRGNITRLTDPKGNVTQYQYSDAANPDRETRVIDDGGEEWDYTYDAKGRPTLLTTPLTSFGNTLFEATYDAFGNMTSFKDAARRVSTFTFDSTGNRTAERPFDAPAFDFEHSREGSVSRRVFSESFAVQYEYDANGHPATQTDDLGHVVETQYLKNGRLQSVTDCCGSLDVTFSPGGLLASQTDIASNTAILNRNADGSLTRTDRNGNVTTLKHDTKGRPVLLTLPGGGLVTAAYDADGNPSVITDPAGNTTTYTVDSTNLVTAITDHVGRADSFSYDAFGNITEIIDRNGKRRTFQYDANRRLTHERWHDGGGAVIREIVFTQDVWGLQRVDDTAGAVTHTHRISGILPRPNSMHVKYHGQQEFRVVYNWADGAGRQLPAPRLVSVGPGLGFSGQILGTYHGGNALQFEMQHPGGSGNRVDIRRNLDGTIRDIERYSSLGSPPLQSKTRYTYDALNRLRVIRHESGSGALVHPQSEMTFDFDPEGRITGITQAANTTAITHDDNGQILTATHSAPNYPDEAYTYDIAGNRATSHLLAGSATIVAPNRVTAMGSLAFVLDLAGNVTRRTNTTTGEETNFTYDHRNRLSLATVHPSNGAPASHTLIFDYDYLDRLISRDIDGVKTWIVYDREMPLAEFANGASNINAMFFYSLDRLDDFHMVWRSATGEHWFLKDNIGSIRGILGDTGTLLSWSDYDTFGNLQPGSSPANGETLRFAGRFHLPLIGLYENRRRYYDPQLGRFTQEDPVRIAGGDFNLYRYALNHPTAFTDPTGETAYDWGLLLETFIDAVGAFGDEGGVQAPCHIARWSAANFGYLAALPEVIRDPFTFTPSGGGGAPSIERIDLSPLIGCPKEAK